MSGGRPPKEFHEYLTAPNHNRHVSHSEYLRSPGTAFLKYAVEAKSASEACVRRFRNDNGRIPRDAENSLQQIITSMLPAIMGHFETFQKYLFAGVFELSPYLSGFDGQEFFKKLGKETSVTIDPVRLAAYRGQGASSVGVLLADSLPGWHDPEKVHNYFKCFGLDFFDNDSKGRLKTLWQLRHSIVHTGGTLTLADSQKVDALSHMGETQIAFENHFIFEVARKFHPLVQTSTGKVERGFRQRLAANTSEQTLRRIDEIFEVRSSHSVWLRN